MKSFDGAKASNHKKNYARSSNASETGVPILYHTVQLIHQDIVVDNPCFLF